MSTPDVNKINNFKGALNSDVTQSQLNIDNSHSPKEILKVSSAPTEDSSPELTPIPFSDISDDDSMGQIIEPDDGTCDVSDYLFWDDPGEQLFSVSTNQQKENDTSAEINNIETDIPNIDCEEKNIKNSITLWIL